MDGRAETAVGVGGLEASGGLKFYDGNLTNKLVCNRREICVLTSFFPSE